MINGPNASASDFLIKEASTKLSIDQLLEEIKKVASRKVALQIFDPDSVINKVHLIGAYINATVAFKNHSNKANNLSLEMLLFAAMTNQINVAIEKVGAKSSSKILVFSNDKKSFRKISKFLTNVKDFNRKKAQSIAIAQKFGINQENIDALLLQSITLSRLAEQ